MKQRVRTYIQADI